MILSGRDVAHTIQRELKERLSTPAGLAVVLVGDNQSSLTYINMKRRACAQVGITSTLHHLPPNTAEEHLLALIHQLNNDPAIDGILVQLPLPRHINAIHVIEAIDPKKDVDGFHPVNLGKLVAGLDDGFVPCTPLGILKLLEHYQLPIAGKHAVIVGRSAIVGKPLSLLLLQKHATVTTVHSRTQDLPSHTRQADILVAAVGLPRLIKADMVKQGAVVIDVGINQENNRLVGDVDFTNVEPKCQAITPVPGGVGPMTVAMLLHNTVLSAQRRRS